MSWSIKEIGERSAVRKAVENNTYLPAPVKTLILETIHEKVPEHSVAYKNGIRVEGFGHHNANDGTAVGNISKLEVEPFLMRV